MAFIDYPDHLPQGPLSPEAAAIFETLTEVAKRLDIRIGPPNYRGHVDEVVDLVLPSMSRQGDGPLVVTVLKNRTAKEKS